MPTIPKVDPFRDYKLRGETLNKLIEAANSWSNLRIETLVTSDDVSRLIRSAAGSVLRIVIPPVEAAPGGSVSYRELTAAIGISGFLPTPTEISTALASAYTAPDPDLVPAAGDLIILTISGTPRFGFMVRSTIAGLSASGSFLRSFVVNSVTYYAIGWQLGIIRGIG